ncbi:MAG: TolC family protein [Bacteroidetes bacterium]|nr:TolC family protein [Bacteroidota bacterium]
MKLLSFFFSFFLFSFITLNAQNALTISIVNDSDGNMDDMESFARLVKKEVDALLEHRYSIRYKDYYGNYDSEKIKSDFETAFEDSETDIVIGLGLLSSGILFQREHYSKPSVATLVMDQAFKTEEELSSGTSGIPNFTYVASPFSLERDIKKLHEIFPFKKIGVIAGDYVRQDMGYSSTFLEKIVSPLNVDIQVIPYTSGVPETVALLDEEVDAVYVLPLFRNVNDEDLEYLFEWINEKKLPSAALVGEIYLNKGAFMAYEADFNFQRIPRRVALNVMKILEGSNAADLPVNMKTYNENLLINMATARKIEVYPDWEILAEATLFKLNEIPTTRTLSLQGAIAEGLHNNLSVKMAESDVEIAIKEVDLSKSDLLPQVDVSTSFSILDEITAASYSGARGRYNLTANGSLSQIIFSEPLFANMAIQKLLKENEDHKLHQTRLDLVVDIATAYMNILRAKSNLEIQQNNFELTRENYEISKTKEAVGYSGVSDLNRWSVELALSKMDFLDANASWKQAKFQLNQLLNRPIDENFDTKDITLEDEMNFISQGRESILDNYGLVEKFGDFLVLQAEQNLPELKQLDIGIDIQGRLETSQKRAYYLPSVAASGAVNRTLDKWNIPFDMPATDNITTWNIGVGVQFPVFQGNSRRHALDQTKLNIIRLEDQRADIRNQLELLTRVNIENIITSFSKVELAEKAAEAARRNFLIVQRSYTEGLVNITTLIDAQTNTLQTELNAVNSVYSFVLDFLNLERSIGAFFFLLPEDEQNSILDRFSSFLIQNQ